LISDWVVENLEDLRCENRLEVIEMDEMHTYIGTKKAIVGYGLLLTDLEKDLSSAFLVQEVLGLIQ